MTAFFQISMNVPPKPITATEMRHVPINTAHFLADVERDSLVMVSTPALVSCVSSNITKMNP